MPDNDNPEVRFLREVIDEGADADGNALFSAGQRYILVTWSDGDVSRYNIEPAPVSS